MEVKINKEIRAYKENMFFGLSLRQFTCTIGAVGVAVGIYFLLRKPLGQEIVSWLCIVGAAPIGAAGFFQYNGMTIEKFIVAFIKSEFLYAGMRVYKSENHWIKLLNEPAKKGGLGYVNKNISKQFQNRKRSNKNT